VSVSSLLPLLGVSILVFLLGAGCFAHTPVEADQASTVLPEKDDGLPEAKMAFLGVTPEQWETRVRAECEQEPAGDACSKLFDRAADRFRWDVNIDEAPGLLVHACAQDHRLSCKALELLQSPSLDNAGALAQLGCPRPFEGKGCYATAFLLSHSCNEKKEVASCLALAYLFAKSEPPDVVWLNHYRVLACAYGGFCDYRRPTAPSQHVQGAE
jgi:hypothetical protein